MSSRRRTSFKYQSGAALADLAGHGTVKVKKDTVVHRLSVDEIISLTGDDRIQVGRCCCGVQHSNLL
jgi:hypothetical protein